MEESQSFSPTGFARDPFDIVRDAGQEEVESSSGAEEVEVSLSSEEEEAATTATADPNVSSVSAPPGDTGINVELIDAEMRRVLGAPSFIDFQDNLRAEDRDDNPENTEIATDLIENTIPAARARATAAPLGVPVAAPPGEEGEGLGVADDAAAADVLLPTNPMYIFALTMNVSSLAITRQRKTGPIRVLAFESPYANLPYHQPFRKDKKTTANAEWQWDSVSLYPLKDPEQNMPAVTFSVDRMMPLLRIPPKINLSNDPQGPLIRLLAQLIYHPIPNTCQLTATAHENITMNAFKWVASPHWKHAKYAKSKKESTIHRYRRALFFRDDMVKTFVPERWRHCFPAFAEDVDVVHTSSHSIPRNMLAGIFSAIEYMRYSGRHFDDQQQFGTFAPLRHELTRGQLISQNLQRIDVLADPMTAHRALWLSGCMAIRFAPSNLRVEWLFYDSTRLARADAETLTDRDFADDVVLATLFKWLDTNRWGIGVTSTIPAMAFNANSLLWYLLNSPRNLVHHNMNKLADEPLSYLLIPSRRDALAGVFEFLPSIQRDKTLISGLIRRYPSLNALHHTIERARAPPIAGDAITPMPNRTEVLTALYAVSTDLRQRHADTPKQSSSKRKRLKHEQRLVRLATTIAEGTSAMITELRLATRAGVGRNFTRAAEYAGVQIGAIKIAAIMAATIGSCQNERHEERLDAVFRVEHPKEDLRSRPRAKPADQWRATWGNLFRDLTDRASVPENSVEYLQPYYHIIGQALADAYFFHDLERRSKPGAFFDANFLGAEGEHAEILWNALQIRLREQITWHWAAAVVGVGRVTAEDEFDIRWEERTQRQSRYTRPVGSPFPEMWMFRMDDMLPPKSRRAHTIESVYGKYECAEDGLFATPIPATVTNWTPANAYLALPLAQFQNNIERELLREHIKHIATHEDRQFPRDASIPLHLPLDASNPDVRIHTTWMIATTFWNSLAPTGFAELLAAGTVDGTRGKPTLKGVLTPANIILAIKNFAARNGVAVTAVTDEITIGDLLDTMISGSQYIPYTILAILLVSVWGDARNQPIQDEAVVDDLSRIFAVHLINHLQSAWSELQKLQLTGKLAQTYPFIRDKGPRFRDFMATSTTISGQIALVTMDTPVPILTSHCTALLTAIKAFAAMRTEKVVPDRPRPATLTFGRPTHVSRA